MAAGASMVDYCYYNCGMAEISKFQNTRQLEIFISAVTTTKSQKPAKRVLSLYELDEDELDEMDFLAFLITFLRLGGGLRRHFPLDLAFGAATAGARARRSDICSSKVTFGDPSTTTDRPDGSGRDARA